MSVVFKQKTKNIKYNTHDGIDTLEELEYYRECLLGSLENQKSCPYDNNKSGDIVKYYQSLFSISLSLEDVDNRINKLRNE